MTDRDARGRYTEKAPEIIAKAPYLNDAHINVKRDKARPGPSRTRETTFAHNGKILGRDGVLISVDEAERLVPRHFDGAQYYDPMQHVEEDEPDAGIWLRRSLVPLMFLIGTLFGWLSCAAVNYFGH